MRLVLFTLPLLYLAWGIIGYLIFKKVHVVLNHIYNFNHFYICLYWV
ncbi:DUF2651 family protein [Bacillus pumilus]|nr:DUF2651 family protein [Bacillus pumilus]